MSQRWSDGWRTSGWPSIWPTRASSQTLACCPPVQPTTVRRLRLSFLQMLNFYQTESSVQHHMNSLTDLSCVWAMSQLLALSFLAFHLTHLWRSISLVDFQFDASFYIRDESPALPYLAVLKCFISPCCCSSLISMSLICQCLVICSVSKELLCVCFSDDSCSLSKMLTVKIEKHSYI